MLKPKKQKTRESTPLDSTVRGNRLRKLLATALLLALLPSLIGFVYLALLRETALQSDQINRIASAFAEQQASNLAQVINRLESRMRGAAQSPLALSAIASQSNSDIELVEQAMLDYFPEVTSLRLLPLAGRGTAELAGGTGSLRNHIEVDLVRRTAGGHATEPESYPFETRWLTSMAYLVAHPRIENRTAVIIATIDNDLIAAELTAMKGATGQSVLQQVFQQGSNSRVDDIAVSGNGNQTSYTQIRKVEGTPWQLKFTPAAAMLTSLAINPIPVYVVMAVVIFSIISALLLFERRYGHLLSGEAKRIIAAAEKKTPMDISIPALTGIAKQLRLVTQRSLRRDSAQRYQHSEAPPGKQSVPTMANPLYQDTQIIVEHHEEVLELDVEPSSDEPVVTAKSKTGTDHIFRAYDIRGIADTELGDDMVRRIGGAIGTKAGEMGEQAIIVGADARASSPRIKNTLVKALLETGRDVLDVGTVPTPLLYYATRHLNVNSAVMVTGSHNMGEYNGMKIVLNRETIAAGGIREIRDRATQGNFSKGAGRIVRETVTQHYLDEVIGDIAIGVPLKVVIDAGNGVTGNIAPGLFEELGCDVVPLHCELDGSFPNHPPDTSNEDNLADLVRAVKANDADFGVAFDGDGDRLAVVSNSGKIIRADTLLMLFADDVVSRNPGVDVVFDVKCSRHLTQLISSKGGRPVLWKTGHAFMKQKMRETGALLGGEFSGHIFFGERWFGFDDGMYAAARLAEILSTTGETLDETLSEYPSSVNTPEILIPVDEDYKFELMRKIASSADFSPGKLITLDGVRVDYKQGWGLVRASNTSANLTARFEASSEEALDTIKQAFRDRIAHVDPSFDFKV